MGELQAGAGYADDPDMTIDVLQAMYAAHIYGWLTIPADGCDTPGSATFLTSDCRVSATVTPSRAVFVADGVTIRTADHDRVIGLLAAAGRG